jgi:hypothetical protein
MDPRTLPFLAAAAILIAVRIAHVMGGAASLSVFRAAIG